MKKENIEDANYICHRINIIDETLEELNHHISFSFERDRYWFIGNLTTIKVCINDKELRKYIEKEVKKTLIKEREELKEKLDNM